MISRCAETSRGKTSLRGSQVLTTFRCPKACLSNFLSLPTISSKASSSHLKAPLTALVPPKCHLAKAPKVTMDSSSNSSSNQVSTTMDSSSLSSNSNVRASGYVKHSL